MKKMGNKLQSCGILLLISIVLAPFSLGYAEAIETSQSPKTIVDIAISPNVNEGVTSNFTIEEYESSSALELAEAVRNKRITSVQLVNFAFKNIKEKDATLNAMITLREEEALKEAAELQDRGQPFLGVPLLVKGLGHTITGGSNSNGLTFSKDVISHSTSPFTKAFQEAGFIVIGQTNYPELGLKNITDSKLYGPTGSAWDPRYQAGGSSGGSAAGVAAGYAPVGSGSDAGGSIRIPASWNGVIGLKPSRGVLVGNSASERNQTSHFAETKTMADTKTLFNTFQKKELPQINFTTDLKIGYSTKSPVGTPVQPEAVEAVENAVVFLRSEGFQVEEVDQPYNGVELMKNYYTIGASSAGIIEFLAKQQLKRSVSIDDVDLTTWALYQTSQELTKADVNHAWETIQKMSAELASFQAKYPLFLTPTTASTAPLVGDSMMKPEDIEAIRNMENLSKEEKQQLVYDQWFLGLSYTPFTQVANLTGTPAISLPTYVTSKGLPLGIQFMSAKYNDRLLLSVGDFFEEHKKFNQLASKSQTYSEEK
ncbi:6-aminohexanoate-cyclic-dimer hydrolase [Enterococcus silesiacus]|uniref:6-aminohexanoate-cyclic-dimer hydrolase n=1 Tax=Enterococcus silesiacus TaxID=332949 RepID=A0AA91GA77_9ENTE|nr:amidase family protein [Enterococcus silesiacus]OJG91674.1 6-aminohexanoate-cyclic-dimer hydrolase [Enterococcus silesiacus]